MKVEKLIGANLRVKVDDGRVLDGVLSVIDPFGNLLLANVYETSVDKLNESLFHTRELGLVSVPRNVIKTLMVDKKQYGRIGENQVS
ncbi:hypothetical protein PUMCH_001966 [Australozyma saopauloensis]|uniref:Sm domain-containing protein n=1 Tax=Australozyma saopauloensis TaxID=291208 RepID=A0AAX4H7Z2_9ASCO|nr:hypothetical protein PUMCH_001966 [[Candida] saopauloensis]